MDKRRDNSVEYPSQRILNNMEEETKEAPVEVPEVKEEETHVEEKSE